MSKSASDCPGQPPATCELCPRLTAFRHENRTAWPEWHNRPVPAFGDAVGTRLLVVGLAPGLRGANCTGRPFTGDYAGDLLYPTLITHGFATGPYGRHADDGLTLRHARITNAVRCVPPKNKPTGEEIATCGRFLRSELAGLPNLRVVLALGRIAHDAVLAAWDLRRAAYGFAHGAEHHPHPDICLIDSYHCSRYNVNTRRLTPDMFDHVMARARVLSAPPSPETP